METLHSLLETSNEFFSARSYEKTLSCSICYINEEENQFFTLPCGHFFCYTCVRSILETDLKDLRYTQLCPFMIVD